MSVSPPINARKTYYVKKDFQKRFISEYILLTFVGIVITNWMLYALLKNEIDDAFYKAHIGITSTGDVVLSPLFFTAAAVIVSAASSVLTVTLVNSWKVARRLHCLANGIDALKHLDLTVQVRSCHEDQLTAEVADIFNKTVTHLNKKMGYIKLEIGELEESALNLDRDKTDTAEHLLLRVKSIEDHISAFKLRQ